MEAGSRTLAEHGYANSRLADIAGGAGLTTGAFYRHFSSKEDFFVALFEDYGEDLQEHLNDCPDLRAQFRAWIEVSRAHRGVIRAAAEIAIPASEIAKMQGALRDACGTLLSRHLQGMGSWRHTHGAAIILVDVLTQIAFMEIAGWTSERDPEEIASNLDRLVEKGLYGT